MAEDLSKLWSKFSLFAEESAEVEIQEEALEEITTRGHLCLVGILLADRMVPKEVIKSTMRRVWKLMG